MRPAPPRLHLRRVLLLLLPLAVVTAAVLLSRGPRMEAWLGQVVPACPSWSLFGVLCPGCGNTRALSALLRLDPVTSFRSNPAVLLLALAGLLAWGEAVARAFGRRLRLLPRSGWFYGILGLLLTLFYLMRALPGFGFLAPPG